MTFYIQNKTHAMPRSIAPCKKSYITRCLISFEKKKSKKRGTMCNKLFVFGFLISSATMIIVNGMPKMMRLLKRSKSIDEYQVYPLIFIKTDRGFRLPIDFDYGQKTERAHGHKRKFRTRENESEVFFCPATNPTNENKKEKKKKREKSLKREPSLNHEVSQVCTVEKSENEKRTTVDLKCDPESEPTIWDAEIQTGKKAKKRESILHKYTFGYEICTSDTPNDATVLVDQANGSTFGSTHKIHFEIYDFFYNIVNKEVNMTIHELKSRALLFHQQLEKERRLVYIDDTYGYDFFEDFSGRKKLFKAIAEISDFKVQKLIPVDDFPFALWRKTAYHYLNTGLMHVKLQELWNHIEDTIRKNTQFEKGRVKIYTGAFRIPIPERYREQIPKHEIIHKGYKIPQMWVKFLHCAEKTFVNPKDFDMEMVEEQSTANEDKGVSKIVHKGLAIIANNYLDDGLLNFIVDVFCPLNFCENFATETHPDVHQHVRCCFFEENTLLLLGLKQRIFTKFFEVPGLFEIPKK